MVRSHSHSGQQKEKEGRQYTSELSRRRSWNFLATADSYGRDKHWVLLDPPTLPVAVEDEDSGESEASSDEE